MVGNLHKVEVPKATQSGTAFLNHFLFLNNCFYHKIGSQDPKKVHTFKCPLDLYICNYWWYMRLKRLKNAAVTRELDFINTIENTNSKLLHKNVTHQTNVHVKLIDASA